MLRQWSPERTAGRGDRPGPQHPLVDQRGATMSCSTSHSVISSDVSIIWPAASVLPVVASTTSVSYTHLTLPTKA